LESKFETLISGTEYYDYEYCLCGALKRHKYVYTDDALGSQNLDWVYTTDKLGRKLKEYYPYTIAKDGDDEYHSLLWEHDRAGRRKLYSDPTFGHKCGDTSGWTNDIEPDDEDDWVFEEPQRYRYEASGGLEATSRVKGNEVQAGEGEPYFVERDGAGRIARVIYPNANDSNRPQFEIRYEYAPGGQLRRAATVDLTGSDGTTVGPEKYVVEYSYDDMGRVVKKVIRENQMEDSSVHYSADFMFDGMGRMTRERYMKWDSATPAEQVMFTLMKDVQREYDLGGNVTKETWRDDRGMLYFEEREYARGYQLTDSTYTNGALTTATSGSYTYDTNNNLTETKSLSFTAGGEPYPPGRGAWDFTYDRKNRLSYFYNGTMGDDVMHLRYDGLGRVWQRWSAVWDIQESKWDWSEYLLRFVYDGSQMAQKLAYIYTNGEEGSAEFEGVELDMLYGPTGMMRWKIPIEEEDDHVAYYLDESGRPGAQVMKGTETAAYRFDRDAQGETLWKGEWELSTGMTFGQGYGYVESYGKVVGDPDPESYSDPLVWTGGRHYLPSLGRFTNRVGNNAYVFDTIGRWFTCSVNTIPALGIGPKLPSASPYCLDFYFDECMHNDWINGNCPTCTDVRPWQMKRGNWYNFCCDANCIHQVIPGVGPTPGNCSCGEYAICTGDCTCDHCAWSFGFKRYSLGSWCNDVEIDSSCSSSSFPSITKKDVEDAVALACWGAARCACYTYRDVDPTGSIPSLTGKLTGDFQPGWWPTPWRDTRRNSWGEVWACIGEICRGKHGIKIICDGGSHPLLKGGSALGGTKPGGDVGLVLNITKIFGLPPNTCMANVILHELLHLCGVNRGNVNLISHSTYFFADQCITRNPIGGSCKVNPSLPSWSAQKPCAGAGEPCY